MAFAYWVKPLQSPFLVRADRAAKGSRQKPTLTFNVEVPSSVPRREADPFFTDQPIDRLERACSRCRRPFQPTLVRRLLCAPCWHGAARFVEIDCPSDSDDRDRGDNRL